MFIVLSRLGGIIHNAVVPGNRRSCAPAYAHGDRTPMRARRRGREGARVDSPGASATHCAPMKLGIDTLRDPTRVLDMWKSLSAKTFGKQLFARAISLAVPYTGSISPLVLELESGRAKVQMRDRWGVRNHLRCVHAVALMNLGEAVTGLAVMSLLPPGARGIVRELAMEYVKKARGTITGEARVQVPTGPGTHEFEVTGELRNSIQRRQCRDRRRSRVLRDRAPTR
jgi:acyl-coenzyme A thioesterase PaaI-like protein